MLTVFVTRDDRTASTFQRKHSMTRTAAASWLGSSGRLIVARLPPASDHFAFITIAAVTILTLALSSGLLNARDIVKAVKRLATRYVQLRDSKITRLQTPNNSNDPLPTPAFVDQG